MSDIEELAQLLGQPGEDLDWGCFLEYEHEQIVVADQEHHPHQHLHQPPHIMYVSLSFLERKTLFPLIVLLTNP